jgi:hypothetical protein
MIISFAMTVKEFLSGKKTETRRDWTDRTLCAWQKAWDQGRHEHLAVNRGLHRGGEVIGQFRLTARPERAPLSSMTADSLKAEGGMCFSVPHFCSLVKQPPEKLMTVVRFVKL